MAADADVLNEMEVLRGIAATKTSVFRSNLRHLTSRLCFDQAFLLVRERAQLIRANNAAGRPHTLELLTDDVNSILEASATADVRLFVSSFLGGLRTRGVLEDLTPEALVAAGERALKSDDAGPCLGLGVEKTRRQPDWGSLSREEREEALRSSEAKGEALKSLWINSLRPASGSSKASGDAAGSPAGPTIRALAEQSIAERKLKEASAAAASSADAGEQNEDSAAGEAADDAGGASEPPAAKRRKIATAEVSDLEQRKSAVYMLSESLLRERLLSTTATADGSEASEGRSLVAAYTAAKFNRARSLFNTLTGEGPETLGLQPNGRTYALLVKMALEAREDAEACRVVEAMLSSACSTKETVALHMQPALLAELACRGALRSLGIKGTADLGDDEAAVFAQPAFQDLFSAPYLSHKWCFLVSVCQAAKGDQFGSKHGGVMVVQTAPAPANARKMPQLTDLCHASDLLRPRGDTHKLVAVGFNHRFGVRNDPPVPGAGKKQQPKQDKRLRVMHSEVHCMVQLWEKGLLGGYEGDRRRPIPITGGGAATSADSASSSSSGASASADAPEVIKGGLEAYVVEVDEHGIGYLEGIPCPMCNTGLCEVHGVACVHYSIQGGGGHSSVAISTAPVGTNSTGTEGAESSAAAAEAAPAVVVSPPLRTARVDHKPHLLNECVTFAEARKRSYDDPQLEGCPDTDIDIYTKGGEGASPITSFWPLLHKVVAGQRAAKTILKSEDAPVIAGKAAMKQAMKAATALTRA